jgi:hypothetical protein
LLSVAPWPTRLIERNYIAEPDASDYAFLQINSDRDKVAAWLATRRVAPA